MGAKMNRIYAFIQLLFRKIPTYHLCMLIPFYPIKNNERIIVIIVYKVMNAAEYTCGRSR